MHHDATRRDATDATGHDTTAGVVVDVATAADLLGISPGAVRKRLERGQLAGHKDAGQWRIVLGDIDATDATRQDTTSATRRDGQGTTRRDATAVSPAARSQLEAIRDEWLAPLVAQIREQAEEIGTLRAERAAVAADRDRLAAEVARDRGLADQLVDLLQEERDAARGDALLLEARLNRAITDARVWTDTSAQDAAPAVPEATGATDPVTGHRRAAVAPKRPRWRFWGRR